MLLCTFSFISSNTKYRLLDHEEYCINHPSNIHSTMTYNDDAGDDDDDGRGSPGSAIVVVSKCPIRGKSKTRLIPLLGEEGAATLAKAMLSDVLMTLTHCSALDSVLKILLYAPGNAEGLQGMTHILNELKIAWRILASDDDDDTSTTPATWLLLPMQSKVDLQSSDLGDLLEHALERAREQIRIILGIHKQRTRKLLDGNGSVVFLGMDSPVLPLDDIVTGLGIIPSATASSDDGHDAVSTSCCVCSSTEALLCPADDGGYGMLSVPAIADAHETFQGVHWSHPLTAVSQIKALTDQLGVLSSVRVGTLMHDIDEPEDVTKLCQRLLLSKEEQEEEQEDSLHKNYDMVLDRPSGGVGSSRRNNNGTTTSMMTIQSSHPTCFYTRQALSNNGLLPPTTL